MSTTDAGIRTHFGDLVAHDRVEGRLYTDPDIFAEEMQ